MNNTALRAGAQSANNTHMVFANEEHKRFYYEKLAQVRYQDCYHMALIYILGISEDTRKHFRQIYDINVVALLDCHKPTLIRCHKFYLRNGYGNIRNIFSIS